MEKLDRYRQQIKQVLGQYAQIKPAYGDTQMQTVFDNEGDHYQLMLVGWDGSKRDFGIIIHIDLKRGKIWIQHDGTERGVANDLVEMGIPKEDIVLGYQTPFMRKYSGFGLGDEAA